MDPVVVPPPFRVETEAHGRLFAAVLTALRPSEIPLFTYGVRRDEPLRFPGMPRTSMIIGTAGPEGLEALASALETMAAELRSAGSRAGYLKKQVSRGER